MYQRQSCPHRSYQRRSIFSLLAVFVFSLFSASTFATKEFSSGKYQAQLVELYTSQGCSSCPRAERWLNKFTESDQLWNTIIPVAFHVDYWDYLGWKDPFSSAEFSNRQRNYKRYGNVNSVYTPGFLVNGGEWKGFYSAKPLPQLKLAPAKLDAILNLDTLSVTFTPKPNQALLPVDINIAVLGLGIQTPVSKGENAHRNLDQEFVVLSFETVSSTTGQERYRIPPMQQEGIERYAIAVWASHPRSLEVVQAIGTWL